MPLRTDITIVFETHGLGTIQQSNERSNELLEKIAEALELLEDPPEGQKDKYPLATSDVVAVEKPAEEPLLGYASIERQPRCPGSKANDTSNEMGSVWTVLRCPCGLCAP